MNQRLLARVVVVTSLLLAGGAVAAGDAQASTSVTVRIGHPSPRYAPVPPPRGGWSPGHRQWHGDHHGWVGGSWRHHRPGYDSGYDYYEPRWHPRRHGWGHRPRDRDGDGVPDRHDRRPNNPHRY